MRWFRILREPLSFLNESGTSDAAGNLTGYTGAIYEYGTFNDIWHYKNGTEEAIYLYTASGERLWEFNLNGKNRWTLRDLGGKVLREYSYDRGTFVWTVERDYIYRNGRLLAAETPQGIRHFSGDHLGTPRLVTNAFGTQVAYHVYYPFGEEATFFNQDGERMKLTGHERDLHSTAGPGDDLDYMHARFHSPVTGRFLSADPIGGSPWLGQSWNRYSYVLGNPLKYTDPFGLHEEVRERDQEMATVSEIITVVGEAPRSVPWTPLPPMRSSPGGWGGCGAGSGNAGSGQGAQQNIVVVSIREILNRYPPCGPAAKGVTLDLSTINPSSHTGGAYGWNLE